MTGTGTRFALLSGLCAIALLLSFSAPKAFGYSDVYWIKPDSAANSGWSQSIWQSFVATCDSIDSVTVFVGVEKKGMTYTAQIIDSATQQSIWSGNRSTNGWKFQDMGFGVHKGVVRGRSYKLQMSIAYAETTFGLMQWNYYYRNGNPYPWGQMSLGGGKDLCPQG